MDRRELTPEEAQEIVDQINQRGIYKATREDDNLVLVVSNDDLESYITDMYRVGEYELLIDQETGKTRPISDCVPW